MFGTRKLFLIIVITLVNNIGQYRCPPAPENFGSEAAIIIPNDGSGDNSGTSIQPTCLTHNENPYTFFGTKTTYLHHYIGNQNIDEINLPRK